MECSMSYSYIPIATDMVKKILLGRRYDEPLFIYLRLIGIVSYFPLVYRHGISTNIFHLTFSRADNYFV